MSKDKKMIEKSFNTSAPLKDIIWETLVGASTHLSTAKNKTGQIKFILNGCEVECIVYSPKEE